MLRRKKRLRMEADLTTVFKYALGIYVSVGNISCLMCNRWAFVDAVKAANPKWEPGQPFNPSILDSVTRESVESTLVKSGNTFVKKPFSGSTLDIQI